MGFNLAELREWVGKSETTTEHIAPFPANALAATLNRADPVYAEGTALPPLWHWMHFLPVFTLSDAGYDGHAALGGFLPPVPLPRRMWAGSRLRFLAPLRIGSVLLKTSTVASVDHKCGRSGDLVFVTVQHRVFDGDVLGIEESNDIVYRQAPASDAPSPTPVMAPQLSDFSREVVPDPVLLFRYSALTFNGHRIHYDRSFCTGTEGYPGLVVHGPLLATLLLDLLRRQFPDAVVREFEFRAMAPVFDTAAFSVHGAAVEGGFRLWIRRDDGALAMDAKAVVE
ncbi:MaoC family dehydratase N-terminal domain-containing protein [Pseudorhodobacter sp.]|uniref:FAS1-like dehydratase domain-containing protein n=1 Tax=Pseudorhodobacter sp. TaxID=1934400 RepID=UPI002648ECA8|nr:MaoC family dehydratase N-terminal domain-containing protein [Pseudorhodobacter sp.]MDN5786581.1 MaoC family dehydratase N-terminal domain-containing protein [Pseudorhodobacter sp.]